MIIYDNPSISLNRCEIRLHPACFEPFIKTHIFIFREDYK